MKKKVYRERRMSDLAYKTSAKSAGDRLIKNLEVLSVMANDDLEKTIEVKRPTIDDEGNFDAGGVVLHVKPKRKKRVDK